MDLEIRILGDEDDVSVGEPEIGADEIGEAVGDGLGGHGWSRKRGGFDI